MPLEKKPRVASGYNAQHTDLCERVLVTLLSAFGTLKPTVRLVGGLVPRYLAPEAPPNIPAHFGTSDVDVVLNIELIADGEGYASLADQLAARGFERYKGEDGWESGWRWMRKLADNHVVLVEFLRGAKGEQPGKSLPIDGEKVAALAVQYAEITNEWFDETRVVAKTLDGGGIAVENVRHANVVAFIILKALAFDNRAEPKDTADLIHVIRYAGSLGDIASAYVEKMKSGEHQEALNAGLDALQRKFAEGNDGVDGHLLDGPVKYAQFIHGEVDPNSDEHVADQRYATGIITEFLRLVRAGVSND